MSLDKPLQELLLQGPKAPKRSPFLWILLILTLAATLLIMMACHSGPYDVRVIDDSQPLGADVMNCPTTQRWTDGGELDV